MNKGTRDGGAEFAWFEKSLKGGPTVPGEHGGGVVLPERGNRLAIPLNQ